MKFLKECVGEYFDDVRLGKDFLKRTKINYNKG
jgi:hypothetical protein